MLLIAQKRTVVGYPGIEAVIDAFDLLLSAIKRLEASETPKIHLILPIMQDCVDELQPISDEGLVWRGIEHGEVYPSVHSRELNLKMAIGLKEKVKVHGLWLVGCFQHLFLREIHFVPDMDTRSQYKTHAEALTQTLARQYVRSESRSNSQRGAQNSIKMVLEMVSGMDVIMAQLIWNKLLHQEKTECRKGENFLC